MDSRHTHQELSDLLNARVDELTDGRWSIDQLLSSLEEQARRLPERTGTEQNRRIELLASVLAIRLSLRRVVTVTEPVNRPLPPRWTTESAAREIRAKG